jgi:hypothetical protein
MSSFIVFVLISCSVCPVNGDGNPIGMQVPDSSNDGGYTGDTGGMFGQQLPSDNDGGFTRETVYQQEFVSSQPAPTSSNSWATPGSNYLTQKPSDFGQLTESGTAPGFDTQMPAGQQGPNGLWIVDATGLNRYPEMSIPLYGYAREELTPSVEGQITIEEMYPDGKVRTFGMGYVRPYHIYKMWFYGDVPGTHMIRYSINGYYSNIVRFYVQGDAIQGTYKPADLTMNNGRSNGNEATDPAIAFCIKRGNIYENGKCTFPGGSSCDVLDFYRGNCILTGKPRR